MPIVDYHERAEHWRKRAQELRAAAGSMRSPERDSLLEVADEWVTMADQADRLFKVAQTIGSKAA